MVVAAVDEALTVVLVIEPAGDPRDRGSPELLPVFRRAGVVHHRLGIADNRADEGQVAPVWRPDRAACASGTNVTWRASPGLDVSTTKIWSAGPRRLTKARRRPSGDHSGE